MSCFRIWVVRLVADDYHSGVPGELRGLEYLHNKYGVLPWADVVLPAAKVAREGFRVNEDQVLYMNTVIPSGEFLTEDPTWAIDFAPNGTRVQLNSIMTRKRYADTLEVGCMIKAQQALEAY